MHANARLMMYHDCRYTSNSALSLFLFSRYCFCCSLLVCVSVFGVCAIALSYVDTLALSNAGLPFFLIPRDDGTKPLYLALMYFYSTVRGEKKLQYIVYVGTFNNCVVPCLLFSSLDWGVYAFNVTKESEKRARRGDASLRMLYARCPYLPVTYDGTPITDGSLRYGIVGFDGGRDANVHGSFLQ